MCAYGALFGIIKNFHTLVRKWMPFGSGLISDANRKRGGGGGGGGRCRHIFVVPTDIISYPFYTFL